MNKAKKAFNRILLLAIVFSTVVSIHSASASEPEGTISCLNCSLAQEEKEIFTLHVRELLHERGIDADYAKVIFVMSESTVAKKMTANGIAMTKMRFVAEAHGELFKGSVAYAGFASDMDIFFLVEKAIQDSKDE